MPEKLRGLTEIIFNLTYLFLIWLMVISMKLKEKSLPKENKKVGEYLLLAFFLLALGDTGHVGFRAYAYMLGGLKNIHP
ncbi:hypothetical protein [Caloramator sp. Dgby_cultured_2]|uniref:hypothetical protein n=1 Tax=Caloramator sp. Dgby_cultured_2 TaxID=3029174 RepID=UPI00237E573A|nr:hypothetical protein [Caloramator sp. Dgby_cultured_2]WDU83620.1 hypothetical protein PWK10_03090 [Caloramator sp. Dgby_cultured_2]